MRSLGALLWLGLFLSLSPRPPQDEHAERPPHTRIDLPSRAACGACHAREVAEWSGSLHATAWTNRNIRTATDEFKKLECRPCHSPQPVLVSGLDRPPDFRDFNHEDGVHCLACHGLADGVAAARTLPDAPCRPRAEPRLASSELCWPCHQPTHHAFDEFAQSQACASGKRCADCHMPPRTAGGGHTHAGRGGFDAAFVKKAIEWSVRREGARVVVTVTNQTGHKFPGEISSRSFLVRVSCAGAERQELLLRKPHKGEARADDRLAPDETRALEFALQEAAGEVQVELYFLPLPLLPAEQGFKLGEWRGGG